MELDIQTDYLMIGLFTKFYFSFTDIVKLPEKRTYNTLC